MGISKPMILQGDLCKHTKAQRESEKAKLLILTCSSGLVNFFSLMKTRVKLGHNIKKH